jgi:hypothetical protein
MKLVTPWDWRPSRRNFFAHLAASAKLWNPAGISLDTPAFRDRLVNAANSHESWLVHPFLCELMSQFNGRSSKSAVHLARWTQMNTDADLGEIEIDGYTLGRPPPNSAPLCLQFPQIDPYCTYFPSFVCPPETVLGKNLTDEVDSLARALSITSIDAPEIIAWIASSVSVIGLLPALPGRIISSWSLFDYPGGICITGTRTSDYSAIETVVHEAAHRHLFYANTQSPLTLSGHNAVYPSPLRDDLRPLSGILLAAHALAYIAAALTDVIRTGHFTHFAAERDERLQEFDQAAAVLYGRGNSGLTESGVTFLEKTSEVANYARS